MIRDFIVLDEAERELAKAENWYENQRPGLGSEFLAAIADAVSSIAAWPHLSVSVASVSETFGAKCVYVKRFPYSVVFIEHEETLWIVAFAHQRRRPGYWQRRSAQVGPS